MEPLRIGTLGAARITPPALVKPAAKRGDARVVAVAARDRAKADAFARKHSIPNVYGSYAELIADPDVDAIYNPLPNGLHGRWTIAALEAGKHVLCEKPFTAERRRGGGRRRGREPHGTRRDGGVPLPVPPARRAPARHRR